MDISLKELSKKVGYCPDMVRVYICRAEFHNHINLRNGICYGVRRTDIIKIANIRKKSKKSLRVQDLRL